MGIRISTLFYWCNDVGQMREFYSGVLGLTETYFLDDDQYGWLTYDVDGVQLVFMRAANPLPIESAWARQPGWGEGTREISSTVFQVSFAGFQEVVERAAAKNVKFFHEAPRKNQNGGLAHFVMDPMGYTIELYYDGEEGG